MTSDGIHSYSYDAEGNLLTVDNGGTATYVYDALNRRVGVKTASSAHEYSFDYAGRRISSWLLNQAGYPQGVGDEGRIYWDGRQIAYRAFDGTTYFDHQDYLGTERLRTDHAGASVATFATLPWGDGGTTTFGGSGADQDNSDFAGLDFDQESGSDHAQFRNYSTAQGRWFAPDPYDGSYDLTNPQSFNRYAYVANNPMTFTDPSGQDGVSPVGGGVTGYGCEAAAAEGGLDPVADIWCGVGLFKILDGIFGGPKFHGTLTPRPGAGNPDWGDDPGSFGESLGIGSNIKTGSWGIAPALGLPDAGCEFGACGGIGADSFQQGATTADDWCVQNPIVCGTIAAAAAPIVLPFLASAALLSLEGDNSSGKWTCTASCNLQGIGKNEPPMSRVTGTASGPSEANACLSAKRVATQSAPPGTYARHCQCSCSKQ